MGTFLFLHILHFLFFTIEKPLAKICAPLFLAQCSYSAPGTASIATSGCICTLHTNDFLTIHWECTSGMQQTVRITFLFNPGICKCT